MDTTTHPGPTYFVHKKFSYCTLLSLGDCFCEGCKEDAANEYKSACMSPIMPVKDIVWKPVRRIVPFSRRDRDGFAIPLPRPAPAEDEDIDGVPLTPEQMETEL